jgi:hypothetical protein
MEFKKVLKKYIQYIIPILIISISNISVSNSENNIANDPCASKNDLLSKVISNIQIKPYLKNGELYGIILDITSMKSIFYKIGLEKYDVVHEINDKKVSSLDDFMWLADLILTSSLKKIKISRIGKIEIINVDADQLNSLLTADVDRKERNLSVDFYNVDIQVIIRMMSEALNEDFLIDPKVNGKATLTISKGAPLSKWHNIFSEFLDLYGYKIISEGEISKIVPKSKRVDG